ncbi:hypothetical protein ANO11243_044080 [Dothideomycetidae sp. 11243]|nr:hypothetical protein ANO11243_044080 [fungal sp. No.11243]
MHETTKSRPASIIVKFVKYPCWIVREKSSIGVGLSIRSNLRRFRPLSFAPHLSVSLHSHMSPPGSTAGLILTAFQPQDVQDMRRRRTLDLPAIAAGSMTIRWPSGPALDRRVRKPIPSVWDMNVLTGSTITRATRDEVPQRPDRAWQDFPPLLTSDTGSA